MKKITILISIVLSLNVLSLFCLAQGSVNSNNALGEPADGPTNDPYTDSSDPVLTDGTVPIDTVTNTLTDTAPAATASDTVSDTAVTTGADQDGAMTSVIILIIAAVVVVAAIIITVIVMKKSRRD